MAWVAPCQHGEVYVKSCWMVWMVRQQAQARDTWSPWWPLRGKWQKHCNASRRRFEGQCSPERGRLSHNSTWDVPNTLGHQIVATRGICIQDIQVLAHVPRHLWGVSMATNTLCYRMVRWAWGWGLLNKVQAQMCKMGISTFNLAIPKIWLKTLTSNLARNDSLNSIFRGR